MHKHCIHRLLAAVAWSLMAASISAEPDQAAPQNSWVDWVVASKEFKIPPFEGERYQAQVPDTPDLVEHAQLALNPAKRLWAPEWGFEQYFISYLNEQPPVLEMGHGGLLNCGPKVIEALPMLRSMTGDNNGLDGDAKIMRSLLIITGKDGLCYQPIENRPWAFFEDSTRKIGKPYCDIFGEGRQLMAYASWYQHDHNPFWKELAERKIKKLQSMTLKKDDGTLYFRLSRGYTPWDKDPTAGPVVPIGDHVVYDPAKGMVGTAACYIVGWIPMAGGIWNRIAGSQEALILGSGLANYLYKHGEMIDAESGKFLAEHETHVSHSLFSNLSYALAAGDKEQAEWVRRAYEWHIKDRDPNMCGIIFRREACGLGDDLSVGTLLSVNGLGDYWDYVDLWLRNSFLNQQVTPDEAEALKQRPATHPELKPGRIQPADGVDQVIGMWRLHLDKDMREAVGCCTGNCSRDMYNVWSNIVTNTNNALKVNLLLNRASEWADIDSYVPYEGKVVVTMKVDKPNLLVRVPGWTKKEKVSGKVGEHAVMPAWEGNYLSLGAVKKGEKIIVEFPMETYEVSAKLKDTQVKVTLKGGTVIDLQPPLPLYPLEKNLKYKAGKAPLKDVTRFVSNEHFVL